MPANPRVISGVPANRCRGGRRRQRRRPAEAGLFHALIALMRRDNRDSLRLAVLRWSTPTLAPRMMCGCALVSACMAASRSPVAIASSTLRIMVLMLLRRDRFTAVRRAILRIAFFAEGVLAISMLPL